jgi:isopenicillin-N epimerase
MQRRDFIRLLAAMGFLPAATAMAAAESWPAADDPQFWSWIRRQFYVPQGQAYFNVGTLGACPRQVIEAVVESMRGIEQDIAAYDYRPEHTEYISGYRKQEELRGKVASLINASAREVALVQNATMGSNFIAHGLELHFGDEVLMTDQEHIGNRGPWELREKRDGIVVRKLAIGTPPADPESVVRVFAEAITPKTRIIDVPHITSKLGIVLPVEQICALARDRGIFTLIDGAQAIGHLHIDVKAIGCDAYTTSPHKWLLAPPGNGVLYVREGRIKDVWATLASGNWNDYDPADGVFRLMQYGTGNRSLLDGFDAAVEFHRRIGPERVERRIAELSNRLRDGLKATPRAHIYSPTHQAMACGIVTWGLDGVTGPQLMDALWNRAKIRVRSQDDKMVRQSSHIYNSAEEIDVTLEIARALTGAS